MRWERRDVAGLAACRGAVGLVALALALCGLNEARALPMTYNMATAGTATGTTAVYGSSLEDAIDGDRNGDFNAGSVYYGNAIPESPPLYYEVDLGTEAYVDRVQLLRRTDADQGVFGNMRLTIYEDDGLGGHGAVAFTGDYLTNGFSVGSWGTTDPGAAAPGGVLGRFVRLERLDNNYWLTFAEFEVIGSTSPLLHTESHNIARGKPVTTSSPPGYGALITSGNDGDINADFNQTNRSVYHSTDYGVGEYWQVDLGAETPLDYLELFVRSDAHTTDQFKVSVLDGAMAEVGSFIVDNAGPSAVAPDYDLTIDASGLTGRYLRVETTHEQFLSFTELRAFAAVPEPSTFALAGLAALVVTLGTRCRRSYPRRR